MITTLGVAAFILIYWLARRLQTNKKLPPGPKGLPILGNVLQLASTPQLWLLFDKMKTQYGPIMSLSLAGQNIVVLNTKAAALELMGRRSATYSDRPASIVADILGRATCLPFMKYGKQWQRMRRAGHAVLNARASVQYLPIQVDEAIAVTRSLLTDQSSPLSEKIHRSASSMISVIYGKQLLQRAASAKESTQQVETHCPVSVTDPLQTLIDIVHPFTIAMCPGAHLVEFFPFLNYFPAAICQWKQKAITDFEHASEVFTNYYTATVGANQMQPNLCASLAENKMTSSFTEFEKAWVTGTISAASLETTSTTMSFFLYAMSLYPDVQRRAQDELDRVVGKSRNPNFNDMEHLPYLRALVKELLRWQPVTPLAIPHATLEDDWYEGYLIPKGTTVLANVWSMNHDEDVYGPDVDQFKPERYLEQSEDGTGYALRPQYENDDGHSSYGFECVGRHVANHGLFINIATILWALSIEAQEDAAAAAVKKKSHRNNQDILNPVPHYDCRFTPRFPEVEGILQHYEDNKL
ncbi:cytochrome P450 [Lentinula raphanica]|nr:cytochrome P450 [Lentinula raphanica]